jgi:hypothetical protein
MVEFLIFNNKRGYEYAIKPLAVPVDVLEFCSIPQILPHALTEHLNSEHGSAAFFLWRDVSSTPGDHSCWPCERETRVSLRVVCY